MGIDNPEDNSLPALWRLVKRLARANPLNNGSVDRGALTIRSPEGLVVGVPEGAGAGQGSQKVYGTIEVTGTLRGDGTIDWEGPVQLKGKVDVTGRMHVMGGGRIVSSDVGDVNYSMQMFYKDARGNVVAFGVPMLIQAWESLVQLNEDNLRISTVGNASVQLNRDGMRIEAGGNSITMSEDSVQIVGNDGAGGAWIELRDGDIFFRNVPDS